MRLTKNQWEDAITDITNKIMTGLQAGTTWSETPAQGELPEILFGEMKHCIGLDDERPYRRNDHFFYKPYRNYYGTGPSDEPMWGALTEMGYARKDEIGMHHLTLNGIAIVSYQNNIFIYNPGTRTRCLEDAKSFFIQEAVFCGYGCWRPVSKRYMQIACRFTKIQAKNAITDLVDEGWINPSDDKGIMDDGRPFYRKGWTASDKLRATEEYKKAWGEERKIIDRQN